MNHTTGCKEEKTLKERVRHQVEDACGVCSNTAREEHVTKLRDRGVREDLFDVRLRHADGSGIERGDRTYDGDDKHRDRRAREKRVHPRHDVDTRGNHRRRVNQGADGRWALHCVWQPNVKRKLGRFANRARKKKQADRGNDAQVIFDRRVVLRQRLEDAGIFDRMKGGEHEQNADHETHVTDTRGDKGLFARVRGGLLQEPEADQQVAAEAHTLPTDECDEQVRAEYQREHEKDEQIQVAEEAVIARVVRHVTDRKDVHEKADAGDDEQHYDGELINLERKVRAKRAGHHPGEVAMDYGDLVCRKLRELAHRFADANER